MSGLAEAHGHLERAIRLWDEVPAAAEVAGLELAEVCAWAAQLAEQIGAAPRAVVLARRAIELTPDESWQRLALLHVRLGEYLHETAEDRASLAALERAVALTREHPAIERAGLCAVVPRGWTHGGVAIRRVAADGSRGTRPGAGGGRTGGGGAGPHRARGRPGALRPRG